MVTEDKFQVRLWGCFAVFKSEIFFAEDLDPLRNQQRGRYAGARHLFTAPINQVNAT